MVGPPDVVAGEGVDEVCEIESSGTVLNTPGGGDEIQISGAGNNSDAYNDHAVLRNVGI